MAAFGLDNPHQTLEQGGFSSPIWANNSDKITAIEGQRDIVKNPVIIDAMGQIMASDKRHCLASARVADASNFKACMALFELISGSSASDGFAQTIIATFIDSAA